MKPDGRFPIRLFRFSGAVSGAEIIGRKIRILFAYKQATIRTRYTRMYFLLLFLFLIAAIVMAIFFEPVSILFFLDTDKMDMHTSVKWIPFIRIEARVNHYRPFITVYFFRTKIYAGFLKQGKKSKSRKALFETMALSNTSAKISYGLSEPYLTGLFCGAADFIAVLIRSADIALEPEFIPENEFLKISAKTQLNAGKTFINMLRKNIQNSRRRNNYGSA